MSSVSRRADASGRPGQWIVRWREADGRQRKRTFTRRATAERFKADLDGRVHQGEYVPPEAGRVTVGQWVETWFAAQNHLKPSTAFRYGSLLRTHVVPRWGAVRLQDVRHADVAEWVGQMGAGGLSASSVRHAYRMLSMALDFAVKDGRLTRNVCAGVSLPRLRRDEPHFLALSEVRALAEACSDGGHVVLMLACTGLRFGELTALRAGDFDWGTRRVRVHRTGGEISGRYVEGTPKTHQARTIVLPEFLVEVLRSRMEPDLVDAYAFPAPAGGPLRLGNWRRRVFDQACADIGLKGVTPHDLRHTAASIAIRSGASVKAVQRMLGHASAAMTLDVYAGLFADELDDVAQRMNDLAPQMRPTTF